MHSVKVHWVVGLKQKQWLAEEVFWNIIHMQTYNWTKYAFCESTLSGGPQAEAMGFRRSFSKPYTHSNIQLNKVCSLWKYTEWLASSRSSGLQKKFFKTLYIFQTYNWTEDANCESALSGGLQAASNGFQKNIFKSLYKFKQTIEQGMHSVKLHWAVGLKQKQWVSEEIF